MISECEPWKFTVHCQTVQMMQLSTPTLQKTFLRWPIGGPIEQLQHEERDVSIQKTIVSISKIILYAFKSDRQM